MKSKIIRECVRVVANSHKGVYEATDDPEKMVVNLQQREFWIEDGECMSNTREVEWETDISLYRIGSKMPGMIKKAYQLEPITEQWEEYMVVDDDGNPIVTESGSPIWHYCYYNPHDKFILEGPVDEDRLQDIIEGIEI